MMKLTPLHVRLLLHFYTTSEWAGQQYATLESTARFRGDLERWGLIERDTPNGYRTTEGGKMLIDAICGLTIPRRTVKWTMEA